MLKVTNKPIIDFEELEREFNIHLDDCEFAEMAENGSYVPLFLNDEAVKDLEEAIDRERSKSFIRLTKLTNQLNLVKKLRELGYTDEILVFIFW